MNILIGTKNNAKIEGLTRAFREYFDDVKVTGIAVKSEVSEQPVNDETYLGCCNRVKNLKKYAAENDIEADFFAAIESGIVNFFGKWQILNVAVIEDSDGLHSYGTSAGFPIPEGYAKMTLESDLSMVINNILKPDCNVRAGKGGIGLLTKERITRVDLTYQAFVMALTQVINEVWREEKK